MPADQDLGSEAQHHAAVMERAANYFAMAAKRGDLGFSPNQFDERVKAFFAQLDASRAFMLAILNDHPCPIEFFAPWASDTTIWRWRMAKDDPLPYRHINKRVMVRPSDFFAALEKHSRTPTRKGAESEG